jgi:sporulation protein YlmC with PRC-barrel domain
MANAALRSAPKGVRRLARRRHRRRPLSHATDAISVAGLVGSNVTTVSQRHLGKLEDLLVRWDEPHPRLTGAIVRRGRERMLVRAEDFAGVLRDRLVLSEQPTPQLDAAHAHDVRLARDVLDRQILDVDGSDVTRVSDLALVQTEGGFRLAGVDVSARTLLRRAGRAWLRRRVAADRLYDWAELVAAVGAPGSLQLTTASTAVRSQGAGGLDAIVGREDG